MSTATWATAQVVHGVPAAPARSGESATALPALPGTREAARSPQLSHAATEPPVGTIIHAINAQHLPLRATAAKARWRLISTLPVPDMPSTAVESLARPGMARLDKARQGSATGALSIAAVAPVSSKLPAAPAPASSPSRDRILLAELDADLERTQGRLDEADAKLAVLQRQLASFTNALHQAMLEAGPDAKGLHPFVRVAERYAGTPYIWGAASSRGFDCSGFIIRVMRDLGYPPLPHSAAVQFNYGQAIASPLLKPGDLVFFKNTYKRGVSHVGIYLGRRRFIHAAGTGLGTIVSSLNDSKWRPGGPHYAGGRRLIPARG
ncbi:MAG TPA: C40 family peptidase [Abditibacteriaceae bacterium]|nr:C40 family peptidase [Abditibacteriaceae bacterium]